VSLPALTLDDLPAAIPTNQEREDAFIRNLFIEPSVVAAALKAGYPETSATSYVYQRLRNPKFQERIREYARTHELVESVPVIMRLEHNALKYLEDKPQELPKYASILKQKKQIAGLLSQDVQPQQATISIGQVSNLMLNVSQAHIQDAVNVADNSANIINMDDK
jgi:phage terminase small subunit